MAIIAAPEHRVTAVAPAGRARSTRPAGGAHAGVDDRAVGGVHQAQQRLGLFDVTVQAGRTDWADPAQVTELAERWDGLLTLLRAHGDHEDQRILRLLDPYDPLATESTAEQHRDLDDLLDDLAERFETVLAAPGMASGLELYRYLARFVAAYLTHMHDEAVAGRCCCLPLPPVLRVGAALDIRGDLVKACTRRFRGNAGCWPTVAVTAPLTGPEQARGR